MSIISRRYAKALLSRAREEKLERSIYLDMKNINILLQNNFELFKIFNTFQINSEKKKKILLAITKNKISNLTLRFLNLLQKKKRFSIFLDICKDFLKLYNEEKNLKIVYLTTTTNISKKTLKKLKDKMKKLLKCNSIKIILKTDLSLKAGYILKYGDIQIDNSIKTKFKKLKLALLSNL